MKINGHEIEVDNREKVFFPESGLTKGDLIDYYASVAPVILPHIRRYGTSLQRFPDGLKGDGFYVKDTPDYFPDWLSTFHFPEKGGGGFTAPVVSSKAALVYLVDQAVITFHPYLARPDDLDRPDKMIYDLDPPEDTRDFVAVRRAALDLRDVLAELDLQSWVQTTGSKGFHLIVPLDRDWAFDRVRDFAKKVSLLLVRRYEDRYTLEHRKKNRKGRIFLDYLRNAYGATSVAPYAVRARPEASVATPVCWDEVEGGASPRDWTMTSIPRRLGQIEDPWQGLMRYACNLAGRQDDLDALLDQEPPAEEED